MPTGFSPASNRNPVKAMLGAVLLLTILYIGREVLIPIALAAFLSSLIAPAVRALRRVGLSQAAAVFTAVGGATVVLVLIGFIVGSQAVSMASSFPQYRRTVNSKIQTLQAMTLDRLDAMLGEAGRPASVGQLRDPDPVPAAPPASQISRSGSPAIVPVEIIERPLTASKMLSQLFESIKGPLGTSGIVLVVLIFILLEQQSLRDRFIRLLGGTNLQGTTRALDDASLRLSRYFVSQFTVNFGVGLAIGVGLLMIDVPHALIWAGLATILRFVPYVGIIVAALGAALLAAAVDPGWSMLFMTIALFTAVELVASQIVEPHLYGHSTGLSPLSVVVAAIFWSWIWGPVGLLLSTPLTLCLVVAGRHVQSLAFLDLLLGDSPALTLSQRFYQRALSGDADEIVAAAQEFLKRKSLAKYCDGVLAPALALCGTDLSAGTITQDQQRKVRAAVAQVIESLGSESVRRNRWRRRTSILDEANIGLHLRHRREDSAGVWQGPLAVAPGSVVVCIGLESVGDELLCEILVRVLRDSAIDARHFSVKEIGAPAPAEATANAVMMVFLVGATAVRGWKTSETIVSTIRQLFPDVSIVGALPLNSLQGNVLPADNSTDLLVHTFEEALQLAQNPKYVATTQG